MSFKKYILKIASYSTCIKLPWIMFSYALTDRYTKDVLFSFFVFPTFFVLLNPGPSRRRVKPRVNPIKEICPKVLDGELLSFRLYNLLMI